MSIHFNWCHKAGFLCQPIKPVAFLTGANTMRRFMPLAAAFAALLFSAAATAQKPIAYPAKGQSPQQQNKDDSECYAWAKRTTGIDPATVAMNAPSQQQSQPGGERLSGAARGAAFGAIVGDSGDAAATGAIVGGLIGGRRARANQDARNQQSQAQQQQLISTFNRAFGACMEGRGYTIM
jgi:hypothetical protein